MNLNNSSFESRKSEKTRKYLINENERNTINEIKNFRNILLENQSFLEGKYKFFNENL